MKRLAAGIITVFLIVQVVSAEERQPTATLQLASWASVREMPFGVLTCLYNKSEYRFSQTGVKIKSVKVAKGAINAERKGNTLVIRTIEIGRSVVKVKTEHGIKILVFRTYQRKGFLAQHWIIKNVPKPTGTAAVLYDGLGAYVDNSERIKGKTEVDEPCILVVRVGERFRIKPMYGLCINFVQNSSAYFCDRRMVQEFSIAEDGSAFDLVFKKSGQDRFVIIMPSGEVKIFILKVLA